ncbi:factor-independent urate hydroxylase [Rubrobacter indicoceani]|uniref:factor-independent urate hydroxylase n=1 Tax=Rubrobacter indicoceani TaxID=2051957 RepID=UPI000E5BE841|nr:urate oxidase [Rubrobacter indicoceani]
MTGTNRPKTRVVLGQNNYGKSDIRLVKVFRDRTPQEIKDIHVAVSQEGDFEAVHVAGDNSGAMATDTMRNSVYALAENKLTTSIENFGVELVKYFVEAAPLTTGIRVDLSEHPWERIVVDGESHEHAFSRGAGRRTARVTGDGTFFKVEAGVDDLVVLKTTNSGWENFHRDRFTTLPDTDDRILATVVTAKWEYGGATDLDFDGLWERVRRRILATFTDHYSPSVQNTLYRMGRAVLEDFEEVERIHFSLPNRHHIKYDLQRFGLKDENEIFHAAAEPYGLIEGWVERA